MGLVERIKERCKEKATSMNALEKELGFGNGNIRRWEIQKPSYDKVLAVANMLDVSLDWLVTGKESSDLSPEEQKLVNYYRVADDRGKRSIMRTAESEGAEPESPALQNGG